MTTRRAIILTNTFSPLMLKHGDCKVREIREREALMLLKRDGFDSAISHEVTAELLTKRWGFPVEFNRVDLSVHRGMRIIAACPQFRADKAREFTKEEIEEAPWRFFSILT